MRKAVRFVLHPDTQKPVDGLRINKQSKRYYRIADDRKNRHFYPKNGLKNSAYLRRAIFEHDCWRNGQNPDETEVVILTKPAVDQFGAEVNTTASLDEHGNHISITHIHPDDLADYFRSQLSSPENRIDFANRVRMPELLKLDKLRPSLDSMSLEAVGDLYFRKKKMEPKTLRNARPYWAEFCTIVGVDKVSEITGQHIENYHDQMQAAATSPSYLINRFGVVGAAFRFALKRQKDVDNISQVLIYLKMFEMPRQAKPKPKPITPANFHKLFQAADLKWKCILTTSLNCGFYPVDVMYLEKQDLDLDRNALMNYRHKNDIQRVAWLWDRTVHLLREYLAANPHDHPTVFVTQYGKPYTRADSVTDTYRPLRTKAGVSEDVWFAHLRDGTASHSGDNVTLTKMVMGHSLSGEIDRYKLRDSLKVKPACVELENYYFGGNK